MQQITKRIDDTHALLHPHPVDPHEREAAGLEVESIPAPGINLRALLGALAVSLLFWTAGFQLIKALVPYIIWLVEP